MPRDVKPPDQLRRVLAKALSKAKGVHVAVFECQEVVQERGERSAREEERAGLVVAMPTRQKCLLVHISYLTARESKMNALLNSLVCASERFDTNRFFFFKG